MFEDIYLIRKLSVAKLDETSEQFRQSPQFCVALEQITVKWLSGVITANIRRRSSKQESSLLYCLAEQGTQNRLSGSNNCTHLKMIIKERKQFTVMLRQFIAVLQYLDYFTHSRNYCLPYAA